MRFCVSYPIKCQTVKIFHVLKQSAVPMRETKSIFIWQNENMTLWKKYMQPCMTDGEYCKAAIGFNIKF